MDKYFTIHKNDAGTEAYRDQYVRSLEAENRKLRKEYEEMKDRFEGEYKLSSLLRAEKKELRELLRWQYGWSIIRQSGLTSVEIEKMKRIKEVVGE